MTTAEKISIALPPEMLSIIRGAVATGEYASSSEVIRDELREWTHKRRACQQGIADPLIYANSGRKRSMTKRQASRLMRCSTALNASTRLSPRLPERSDAVGSLGIKAETKGPRFNHEQSKGPVGRSNCPAFGHVKIPHPEGAVTVQ